MKFIHTDVIQNWADDPVFYISFKTLIKIATYKKKSDQAQLETEFSHLRGIVKQWEAHICTTLCNND